MSFGNPDPRGARASTDRSVKRAALATFAALILVLAAWPARRAAADDETANTEIQIKAPLGAADCTATPPTITVLGLTIDVSNATFDSGSGDDQGEDDGGATPPSSGGCAALVVGDSVEVQLASDAAPLVAKQVDDQGSEDQEVSIEGPLQAVDPVGSTVQILGLTIDVGSAALDGADDSEDGGSQPIDLTQLIVGQFVEAKLDAGQLPALVATEIEVKNFGNQVEVEVDDQNGDQIDDGASNDVQVKVKDTVTVQAPGGAGTRKKTVQLHATSNGSFKLTGLPTGLAKITVKRGAGVARKQLRVTANSVQHVTMRLH